MNTSLEFFLIWAIGCSFDLLSIEDSQRSTVHSMGN
jgi:hypothetical protein